MNPKSYFEIQRISKLKSVVFIIPLFLVYFFTIGLIALPVKILVYVFGLFAQHETRFRIGMNDLFVVSLIALLVAALHWLLSRRWGPDAILARLSVKKPDTSDRYHKVYADIVEEMRIAGALPRVEAFVIPIWAHNSLALIGRRSRPVVALSEGMISSLTREELQGVVAHELSHVMRGDSLYIGLAASLSDFVYAIATTRPQFLKEEYGWSGLNLPVGGLYSGMVLTMHVFMRLLSCFISREREFLADATAVEMTRNPYALAGALYHSQLSGTNLGDHFNGYSPLFILAPYFKGLDSREGFWARLFSTHPPMGRRLFILLSMAHRTFQDLQLKVPKAAKQYDWNGEPSGRTIPKETPSWDAMTPQGKWMGPYSTHEIVNFHWFNLACMVRLRNGEEGTPFLPESQLREGVRARYVESFVQQYGKRVQKSDFDRTPLHCPDCGWNLDADYYEGVRIRPCPSCGGKLLREETVFRILCRTEIGFSDRFRTIVLAWKNTIGRTLLTKKRFSSKLWCPICGLPMVQGVFSVSYPTVVDRCFRCEAIWFDRHELETLQWMVEEGRVSGSKTV